MLTSTHSVVNAMYLRPGLTGVSSTPPLPKISGFRTRTASCPASGATVRHAAAPINTATTATNPSFSRLMIPSPPPGAPTLRTVFMCSDIGWLICIQQRWCRQVSATLTAYALDYGQRDFARHYFREAAALQQFPALAAAAGDFVFGRADRLLAAAGRFHRQ